MAESTELYINSRLVDGTFYTGIYELNGWYNSILLLDYKTKFLHYKNVLDTLNRSDDLYSMCSKQLFWKEGKLESCIPDFEYSENKSKNDADFTIKPEELNWVTKVSFNEETSVPLRVRRKRINRRQNGIYRYQPENSVNFINEKTVERSFEKTLARLSNYNEAFGGEIFKGKKSKWQNINAKQVAFTYQFNLSDSCIDLSKLVQLLAHSYDKVKKSTSRFSRKEYKRLSDRLKLVLNKTTSLNPESRLNIQLYLEQLKTKLQPCNSIKIPNLFQAILAVFLPNRYYIYPIDEEAFVDLQPRCFL